MTRTLYFGTSTSSPPTAFQQRCYTRVLQGHVALASLKFPVGTSGHKIDAVARVALWKDGLDYPHGTGHGVGHYLNVHEGPEGVGAGVRAYGGGLQPGMTMTIEPGCYIDGQFGIRIENVYSVVAVDTPYR